ncbi:MAG: low molecular weight phosphatase family protein [Candidatus Solibacter sp.]|nr:low molecular weight phosphatase family protein [Candidatus Solibacter sp.]
MMRGRKPKVLFVCIGNACRSQMAEGFAKAYGGDVMEAMSAGLSPYSHVPEGTRESMEEKGISLETHFPKHVTEMADAGLDLVLNLSGTKLPFEGVEVRQWPVGDPFGGDAGEYRAARDRIEKLVMELVLELRGRAR